MTCQLRIERAGEFRLALDFEGPVELAAALASVVARWEAPESIVAEPREEAPPSSRRVTTGPKVPLTNAEKCRRRRDREKARDTGTDTSDTKTDTAPVSRDTEKSVAPVSPVSVPVSRVGVASASLSGSLPSLSPAFGSFLGESESETRARGDTKTTPATPTPTPPAGVATPARIDLDEPMPPWAMTRIETLRMTLGPFPAAFDAKAEWSDFVAYTVAQHDVGNRLALSAARWQGWLKKHRDISRRESTSRPTRPRNGVAWPVQRSPPGGPGFAIGDEPFDAELRVTK